MSRSEWTAGHEEAGTRDDRRPRRWWQFSMRTLMLMFLFCSLIGVGFARRLERAVLQKRAVAEIKKLGGRVVYDYPIDAQGRAVPPRASSIRNMLGVDYFDAVRQVEFNFVFPQDIRDDDLLPHVLALKDLSQLHLGDMMLSDRGVAQLASLKKLRFLDLHRVPVGNEGLAALGGLNELLSLDISNSSIRGDALKHLRQMTNLVSLHVNGCRITDASLRHLRELSHLQTLSLKNTEVTDAGLEHLRSLKNLRYLDLHLTYVTHDGLSSLRNSLPACRIDQHYRKKLPRRLFVMDVADGATRQLCRLPRFIVQGSPEWSASGSHIAFDAHPSVYLQHDSRVFVANVDTGETREIGPGKTPGFSPDGRHLVYAYNGIRVRELDGEEERVIDRRGYGPQWSPDGRWIAFAADGNILLYNLNSGQKKKLLDKEEAGRFRFVFWNLGWSPDSRQLCFQGESPGGARELVVVDIETAEPRILQRDQAIDADFTWAPDGRRILFSRQDPESGRGRLHELDVATGLMTPLARQPAASNYGPDWSPDGKRIVFASETPPE